MLSTPQLYVVTAFLLGLGAFVFVYLAFLVGEARARLRARSVDLVAAPWVLAVVAAVWYGLGMSAAATLPIGFGLVLPFMAFPLTLGVAMTFWGPVRELLREIPTVPLVALQVYRVAGGVFLYPYMVEGVLTPGFSWPAGVGDILTGVAAAPVAWMAAKRMRGWTAAVVVHALFGIADLIVAPASAAAFGFAMEGVQPAFPITSIPLFFGPPLGILLHLVTLRGLWLRERADAPRPEAAPSDTP